MMQRCRSWILLAGAVACTPPSPQANTSGAPAKAEPRKTEPAIAEPPKEPPKEPQPQPPSASPEGELDGRTLIASNDGPWTLRRAGSDGGGVDGGGDSGGGFGRIEAKGGGGGPGIGGYGSGGGEARERAMDSGVAEEASIRAPAAAPRPDPGSSGPPGKTGAAAKMKEKPAAQAPLKAGSTDDNADYKGYLKFLETWTTRSDVAGDFQPLDVSGRAFVRVVDGDRRPLPGVQVTVSDPGTKAPLWKATTYGDGRAPYYPKLFGPGQSQQQRLEVTANVAGEALAATWDGQGEVTLAAQAPVAATGMALDVVFLIDTTGSMGDELEQIKTSLLAVTGKLREKRQDLQLRYGAVAYKDINDDYVTMAHPFTDDTAAFNTALQRLSAGGGGDLPESLNQGLARVVEGMQWRPEAAKVVFLVADAAPQMRLKGDILYGDSAVKAVGLGIRLHSVAASGLDPLGTLVLRQVAQLTRGKFIFIEYGSTQTSAASHGVSGPVQGGNNLDDILLAQLTAEIEGWGK